MAMPLVTVDWKRSFDIIYNYTKESESFSTLLQADLAQKGKNLWEGEQFEQG